MTAATRVVAIAVVSILPSFAASTPCFAAPEARVTPDPRSPIATDRLNVYAVGTDRQTLLMARPGKSEWIEFARVPGADIRGVTWANGHLFFTSATDASLQFVSTTDRGRKPVVLHRGEPFVRPGELTYAGSLIVADPGADTLFHVSLARTPAGFSAISAPAPLRTDITITNGTFLTAWGTGEVMISDTESGFLGQLTEFRGNAAAKLRTMQTKEPGADAPVAWHQRSEKVETVRRKGYPGVDYPGPIAAFNGILYVIDVKSGALFAAGVHDARAIQIPMPMQRMRITRLIANTFELTALDEAGGLHTWPRIVPSELTLLPAARPQSLFPVLQYLYERKLISTRPVKVTGTLDDTLSTARMSWPARSTPIEPETPQGKYASFCLFNPRLCTNGLPNRTFEQGEIISLASLYAERFTIATQVTLDNSRTLGNVADEAIQSEEFKHLTTNAYLRRINGLREDVARAPRDMATGTFRIALEQVRYVVPIEATELRPDTEFQRLRERVRGTLRIAPLERLLNTAAAADHTSGTAQTGALAQASLTALLESINYAPMSPVRTIYVGVAEEEIDTKHHDFVDPNGVPVLVEFGAGGESGDAPSAPPQVSAPCPPPPTVADVTANGAPPVTWRAYHDCDHGTAIASIIGGRTRVYREGFGFTQAIIGMLSRTEANELADDIQRALKESPMTIVNLSLKNQSGPSKLGVVIEETEMAGTALFIISAPNSAAQVELCTVREDWYPACYAKQFRNVLVVGGTTLDAKSIHDRSPVGKYVHLFAPEAGYYAAGRANSYVEVVGTSFATALVSAAAAMLSGAGVTSPELIKQRLMATAKVMTISRRQQWARVLDVKKALTHFRHAVLTDAGTKRERPATVLNKDEVINFRTVDGNRPLPVPIRDIRRLKRVEGNSAHFDLAYITPGGTQLELRAVKAPTANIRWEVRYLPLDNQGLAAGAEARTDLAELFDYVGPIEFQ